jgi:hypothetical protein
MKELDSSMIEEESIFDQIQNAFLPSRNNMDVLEYFPKRMEEMEKEHKNISEIKQLLLSKHLKKKLHIVKHIK